MSPDKCRNCGSENLEFSCSPVYLGGSSHLWVKNGCVLCKTCGHQEPNIEVIGKGGDVNKIDEQVKALLGALKEEAEKEAPRVEHRIDMGEVHIAVEFVPKTSELVVSFKKWSGHQKRGAMLRTKLDDLPSIPEGGEPLRFVLDPRWNPAPKERSKDLT